MFYTPIQLQNLDDTIRKNKVFSITKPGLISQSCITPNLLTSQKLF